MKKILSLLILPVIINGLVATPALAKIDYKGVVTKLEIGTASAGMTIRQKSGKSVTFYSVETTDGLSKEELRIMDKMKWFPSIVDYGSEVLVVSNKDKALLGYKVLKRPLHIWIVIAKSIKTSINAWKPYELSVLKFKIDDMGYTSGILHSDKFEALRNGYYIVAAGGFTEQTGATKCKERLISKGIRDAYIKKLW